ncbi:MAG: hypothetical protein EPO11_05485 [Gammaproteobacteria bacterium]|nr:MAG: hypothetical protein EPO11_05485 [Gammaproteobacteria bacterium]
MTDEKKSALGKTIIKIAMAVPAICRIANRFCTLVEWEARLSRRSITAIIFLTFMAASLLTATWLCVLTILFVYFISLQMSLYVSLFLILLFNSLLLVIILLLIEKFKADLLFPETLRLFRCLTHKKLQPPTENE